MVTKEVKKEVKTTVTKEVKKDVLLDLVFLALESGKSTKQICKELNISKQNLQYYLGKLKLQNRIRKLGYGVWQTSTNGGGRSVRGHGFMWHIRLPFEVTKWDKILSNKGIQYTLINQDRTYQFYFKDNKLWASRKSLVIFDIKSYFGFNAIESKKNAFFNINEFLGHLQEKLGVVLVKDKIEIKTAREHYALVKNSLAMQCKKDGTKINVYNEKGLWFVIDNSFNLDEAETVQKESALIDNLGVQKFFNDQKQTKWEVTPTWTKRRLGECLELVYDVTKNQAMFNENFVSHVEAIKTLSEAVKQLQEEVKKLNHDK